MLHCELKWEISGKHLWRVIYMPTATLQIYEDELDFLKELQSKDNTIRVISRSHAVGTVEVIVLMLTLATPLISVIVKLLRARKSKRPKTITVQSRAITFPNSMSDEEIGRILMSMLKDKQEDGE